MILRNVETCFVLCSVYPVARSLKTCAGNLTSIKIYFSLSIKEIAQVISTEPSYIDWHVRFKSISEKVLYDQESLRYSCFLS